MLRIGHGFDAHKFGGDAPLILGGVTIEHESGLLAHSDGDVVLHAVCDALLGAAALGDIGQHFSDQDNAYENINSRTLLQQVMAMLKDKQLKPVNLDITIVAQAPKMAPHIQAMRNNIAIDCECQLDDINVKATTTEKMGYIGRKEGIAVHAVTLLERAE
ncbi:2-C-methyl-D-erythritol 2,4-cyclodiphosphate synthase [Pleionea mediterranea]|uniref:2-C-methyl-D-erythritol 2,4-cyclodiphosphate synthase n=1 Tax=Pleionea mediterranea TaxID=523701 RepID=A0A316FAW1_9GAMM|nr:2-C-methyl-D-erythritol 2,4-cyclodiphosphate synthase [Pleionea mediterranea]PWK44414.1 2-C-methyl-D-erythritol 2,4-cyclodiphosphate synthase [Pleionea mediterranea]